MNAYDKLRIGTAGSPMSTTGKGRSAGVARSIELGFEAQELEFVHGVNINEEETEKIKALVKRTSIALTAHGPYYINLNAQEPAKKHASTSRVLNTARALHACGGTSATFHAGFYLQQPPETAYETIKEQLKHITKTLQEEGNPITISPETTGKPTQFGSLQELIRLAQDVEGLGICIDFAHLHARSNGRYNTKKEFKEALEAVERGLGKEHLKRMHLHLSGINYGEKGEKNHLFLEQSDLRWKELLQQLKEFKVRGALICESPDPEADAKLIKKTYEAP
ncbi:TIM barrel protein [Candidatus Woesearchaeota archaeon]|nr:TIM barrel protein [Candidatus Woesearchaeota archaeon]